MHDLQNFVNKITLQRFVYLIQLKANSKRNFEFIQSNATFRFSFLTGHYLVFSQYYNLVFHTTHLVCVNFTHEQRYLQISTTETFHSNFIYFQIFACWKEIAEQIFFHFSFCSRCLSWGLNYIHYWPLQTFSQDYSLASDTTHVVCVNFIHERWRSTV